MDDDLINLLLLYQQREALVYDYADRKIENIQDDGERVRYCN